MIFTQKRSADTMLAFKVLRQSVLICSLMLLVPVANAYDVKTYFAISGGVVGLDHDVSGSELQDSTDEGYEFTGGLDLGEHWSLEMSFSDLGEFEYRRQTGSVVDIDDVDLVSFRVNAVLYLLRGKRASERLGFNVFLRAGVAGLESTQLFSDADKDLDGDKFTYGAGIEYGINRSTAFRAQVQVFDDDLAFGGLSVLWRWGRQRE